MPKENKLHWSKDYRLHSNEDEDSSGDDRIGQGIVQEKFHERGDEDARRYRALQHYMRQ